MPGGPDMIFRSTRLRQFFALAALLVSLPVLFGPEKFRHSKSFDFLTAHHLPIRLWAAAFIIYALLLLASEDRFGIWTTAAGWVLGGVLFTAVTAAILITLHSSPVTNSFATLALLDVIAFHAFAVYLVGKTAGYKRGLRK